MISSRLNVANTPFQINFQGRYKRQDDVEILSMADIERGTLGLSRETLADLRILLRRDNRILQSQFVPSALRHMLEKGKAVLQHRFIPSFLRDLLEHDNRILRYKYVPTAIYTHQLVLAKPGMNEYGNPRRTFVERPGAYSEVNGSDTSLKTALEKLISQAKSGQLQDDD